MDTSKLADLLDEWLDTFGNYNNIDRKRLEEITLEMLEVIKEKERGSKKTEREGENPYHS